MSSDHQTTGPDSSQSPAAQSPAPQSPMRRVFVVLAKGAVIGGGIVAIEMTTSFGQSLFFSQWAEGNILTQTVTSPPPAVGPIDAERCYNMVEPLREKLTAGGLDQVTPQVPWQQRSLGPIAVAPIFERPVQSGVQIMDTHGKPMYQAVTPFAAYHEFSEVPLPLARALSFVEDQGILDEGHTPMFNAAINWARTANAGKEYAEKKLHLRSGMSGGSTLLTQSAKNFASADGATQSPADKFGQMFMAANMLYADGLDTRDNRKKGLTQYMNVVSFAAHPKVGEVRGWKMGMAIWFGNTTYDELLKSGAETDEAALAYRQALTLVMAVQMPDRILRTRAGFAEAQNRLEKFVPSFVKAGIITPAFGDKVLATKLDFGGIGKNPAVPPAPQHDKSVDSLRIDLMQKLGMSPIDGFYRLDRCHLEVKSALDRDVNQAVNDTLRSFNDPSVAAASGLTGFQLLRPETAPKVVWAVTVKEVLPDGRVLTRVSTDTFKGALDLNKSGKLNFGSTQKERMLNTYLMQISDLYDDLSALPEADLRALKPHSRDKLTQWAQSYLLDPANEKSRDAMLRASLKRKYSAALGGFFTGGGMNYPNNFDKKDNGAIVTVEEALWRSINLAWFRITDDIEEHIKWHKLKLDPRLIEDPRRLDDPALPDDIRQSRTQYLEDYALYEGGIFAGRAWRELKGKASDELALALFEHSRSNRALVEGYQKQQAEPRVDVNALLRLARNDSVEETERLGRLLSRTPQFNPLLSSTATQSEQLAALYGRRHPEAKPAEMQAFIAAHCTTCTASNDFSKEIRHNLTGHANPGPRFYSSLAVIYLSLHPDADYHDYVSFVAKTCNNQCELEAKRLKKQFDDHAPFRMVDMRPLLRQAKNSSLAETDRLAGLIDRSSKPDIPSRDWFSQPEQLAALYGARHPHSTFESTRAFILKHMTDRKQIGDFKAEYARYSAGTYDPAARFYRFDLNDRAYLTKLHPLALHMAALKVKTPDITWDAALDASKAERILAYKWMFKASNKRTQDKAIGILHDHKAWKEIETFWRGFGYPFRLVPSLATVIGVSGDNTESLTQFQSILLNEGRSINTSRFEQIRFAPETPFDMTIVSAPPKDHQVIPPEVARITLEVARGGVTNDRGTSHRLFKAFKLSDGRDLPAAGKTGTNDEAKTLGLRGGFWTGVIGGRFAVTLGAYVYDAKPNDKFTSGLATRALSLLAPKLQPIFDRSFVQNPAEGPVAVWRELPPAPKPVVVPVVPTPTPVPEAQSQPVRPEDTVPTAEIPAPLQLTPDLPSLPDHEPAAVEPAPAPSVPSDSTQMEGEQPVQPSAPVTPPPTQPEQPIELKPPEGIPPVNTPAPPAPEAIKPEAALLFRRPREAVVMPEAKAKVVPVTATAGLR